MVSQAQSDNDSSSVLKRIFLPSVDVGYQINASSLLQNSVKFATSIEYRIKNNNEGFLRLNYDTYGARYKLVNQNVGLNTIEGTVQITDVSIAPGYRFGDQTYRLMFAVMPGIKLYEFPTATLNGTQVEISQIARSVFSMSYLTTLEYYFDEKSAFTISLYQNQVYKKVDFWKDNGAAYGISVGFITSLL